MFENLTNKLGNVFNSLKKRGALTEKDVDEALKDVRVALLEADVSLEVVKDFIIKVRERAVGQEVLKSVTPGQQVVKIVNDVLIDALGTANSPLEINHSPPVVMLLVGLQGSGDYGSRRRKAARHPCNSHAGSGSGVDDSGSPADCP